jgi:hypothetical protein
MACVRVRSPAFTKLTTITVVADEDWMIEVIPTPVKTPLRGLEVIAERNPRNLSPAAFCKPELIKFIPYRNIPSAPSSVNTCKIPINDKTYYSEYKGMVKMFHKYFIHVKFGRKAIKIGTKITFLFSLICSSFFMRLHNCY